MRNTIRLGHTWRNIGNASAFAFLIVALLSPTIAMAGTTMVTKYKFEVNYRLTNPVQPVGIFLNQDVEPSIKPDTDNDIYIGAIRGVPGGVDVWKAGPAQSANNVIVPTFLGQPDNFSQFSPFAAGGGDIDLAVGLPYATFPTPLGPVAGSPTGNLYSASLFLANIQLDMSKAQGGNGTWLADPAATQTSADDRQWLVGDGPAALYMVRSAVPGTAAGVLQTSISDVPGAIGMVDAPGSFADTTQMVNGGPISAYTFIAGQHHGNVVIDHTPNPATGQPTLYMAFATVDNMADAEADANSLVVPFHTLYVAIGTPVVTQGVVTNVTWTDVVAWDGPKTDGVDHIFPSTAVDQGGNVYVMFSFNSHVYYISSRDHGKTWNANSGGQPTQIDNPTASKYNLFPWMDAAQVCGVDFVWYGTQTSNDPNNTNDQWNVYFAQSRNAAGAKPVINEQIASDHIIHTGQVCLLGISCTTGGNRALADLFQVAIDGYGMANIAYTDDHIQKDPKGNTIPPQTYYTRQLFGPTLEPNGNTTATQLMGGGPLNKFPNGFVRRHANTQLSGGGSLRLAMTPRMSIGRYSLEVGYAEDSSMPGGAFSISVPSMGLNFRSTSIRSLTFWGQEARFAGSSNLGPFVATVVGANPDDRYPAAIELSLAGTRRTVTFVMPQGSIEAFSDR